LNTLNRPRTKFILAHLAVSLGLLLVDTYLFHNHFFEGTNWHELHYLIKGLALSGQLLSILVHPFQLLALYESGGKEFMTPWTFELVQYATLPFSTVTYWFLFRTTKVIWGDRAGQKLTTH
jgi:hypothetical protein